eukprot:jgi/Ulvmu1/11482/UM077_0026.1
MADNYENLKVPELKALLKERSLLQSGRKAELISRLQTDDENRDGAAAVEESRPVEAAAPADAQPQDAQRQPMQNGDVHTDDHEASNELHEAAAAAPNDVPGDAAVAEPRSPDEDTDKPRSDPHKGEEAADKAEGDVDVEAPSGAQATAPASDGHEPVGDDAEGNQLASTEPIAAPVEPSVANGEQSAVIITANGEAAPADSSVKEQGSAPAAESPAKGEVDAPATAAPPQGQSDAAPPKSLDKDPVDHPAAETPAQAADAKDSDNGPSAESPMKAQATASAKSAEQHGDSDSLSLGDSDSDEHEGKADTQPGAESARMDSEPTSRPGDTAQRNADSASKPSLREPEKPAVSIGSQGNRGQRRPRASSESLPAPAPAAKRKHSDIVFPDAPAPAERPAPTKREKVELVVPEALDETCALRIGGLKRPLREADLKQILAKTGAIEGFWIDSCKTHCYVVYGTVAEARETRAAVDGLQWPPRCRSVMQPRYVSLEEAQGMIDSKGAATLTRVPSAAAGEPSEASGAAEAPVIDMTKAAAEPAAPPPRPPRADASQVATGGSTPAEITPLELFELTEARPSLYWLPLTEEQVAQRRGVDAARRERAAAAAADAEPDADAADEQAGDADMEVDAVAGAGSEAGGGDEEGGDRGEADRGGDSEGGDGAREGAQDGDVEMVGPEDSKGGSDE